MLELSLTVDLKVVPAARQRADCINALDLVHCTVLAVVIVYTGTAVFFLFFLHKAIYFLFIK